MDSTTNLPLIFQALFFFLPMLQTLDMTHQFVQRGVAVELPNNNLKRFTACSRHDQCRFLNLPGTCESIKVDCAPDKPGNPKDIFGVNRRRGYGADESDDDLDLSFGDLFASV